MATKYHHIQLSDVVPQQSSSNYGGYTDGDELIVWYNRSAREWQACFSGVSEGNLYESDDMTGFSSKQEAIDYALTSLEENKRMAETQELYDYNPNYPQA